MHRLADSTIDVATATRPAYDRSAIRPGIVHIGLGAFARAHLAVYVDDLLAGGRDDLGIIGVSLHNDDTRQALEPQDGLYTLGVVDGAEVRPRIIGSVQSVLHAPTQPDRLRHALASLPLVTATVTEKGYCWNPATRRLDLASPGIAHDIAEPHSPRTFPGHLVLMAQDRRSNGDSPVTVVSLDNVPANGDALRDVVVELAQHTDPSLARWIEDHVGFPCSMVDRMVPATDDAFRASIRHHTGVDDHWPVRAEPFSQWVLEGGWLAEMPPLELAGVELVGDVAPWEALKLEVLNALHTAAAHFGLRHELPTIDTVVGDPDGRAFVDAVAHEIRDVVQAPAGVLIDSYISTTMARFANGGLGHRCSQIATDTSQKLPQRLLGTLRRRLECGLPIQALAEVLALWAWSTRGVDAAGRPRTVNDPLASRFEEIVAQHGDDSPAFIDAVLALDAIFGDLGGNVILRDAVLPHYERVLTDRT